METLWVVMPAFNESEALPCVLREWSACLRHVVPAHVLCVLDDGSTDPTPAVLEACRRDMPELMIVRKTNSGHGQTCIEGYRRAIEGGARWILQIDADGQCDPRFFAEFWEHRNENPVQYGFRFRREDGYTRLVISRIVSLVAFLATGTWVRDPNVPYRLMRADALAPLLPRIPADVYLANILLAVLQQRETGIRWRPIVFRKRIGGVPSAKIRGFAKRGWQLYRQLRRSA